MEVEQFVRQLSSFLAPFLSHLLKQKTYDVKPDGYDSETWETAIRLWSRLGPWIRKRKRLGEAVHDVADSPFDPDALASLRMQIKKLLSSDQALAGELLCIWEESAPVEEPAVPGETRWREVLDRDDDLLRRLDIVRLLRAGMQPEKIAEEFCTGTEYLYRLNAAFSLSGPGGLISPDPRNWLDQLSKDDPVLRRLEMVRLVRSGTPPDLVARQYSALPEYIGRIDTQFSENGVAGILTEEDFLKFRSIYPKTIGVCTLNLHGWHNNNRHRLRRIAHAMSGLNPSLCAFQEVISGPDIKDTGAVISEWMTKMSGSQYRTHFAYCHLFMDKHPEGVSVSGRHPFRNVHTIDLNKKLWKGLRPLMDRYAAVAETEIYGRRFVFVSVHLDHAEDPEIRLAQAMKLLAELAGMYSEEDYDCLILAGDFNDVEDSPVIEFLKKEGFRDTFGECGTGDGFTYTSADPHKRIDFILVRGDVTIQSSRLILESPELSDHKGVFTLLNPEKIKH
jgi:endonuclease/exonuclease/phosphatase family metal-dependent hydrolase